MREHRYQLLRHMAASENVYAARGVYLLGVKLPAVPVCALRFAGHELLSPLGRLIREKPAACRVNAQPAPVGDLAQQPHVVPFREAPFSLGGELERLAVPAGDVPEIYLYVPAADHAEVLHVVFCKGEVVAPAFFLLKHLGRYVLGAVFHRAAAYRAADAPFPADKHPRAGPARRRARGGDHGNEHYVLPGGELFSHGPKHIPHKTHTSFSKCSAAAALPPSPNMPAKYLSKSLSASAHSSRLKPS